MNHKEWVTTPDATYFHGLVGASNAMQMLFHDTARLAKSDAPVLILGESGTGKELLARAIHAESLRHNRDFIAVNCASIPAELMESEFFGHLKGAFTGAHVTRKGLFQMAQGGSLFLDEIGEMPSNLQAKLLRALQEKTIRPVGSEREEPVDVRIIAATHRDLEKEILENNFRSDLFYRLETFSLRIPPLRERANDIEHLLFALIDKHTELQDKTLAQVEPEALNALLDYSYPGNVRELENAIMRAITLSEDGILRHRHLPERLRTHPGKLSPGLDPVDRNLLPDRQFTPSPYAGWPSLQEIEKRYIYKVLEATGGNKRRTAEMLGIARRTLYRRLEED
ncbi:sigma-54 dependent transcriptional regulator [Halomonas sediminis]